MKTQRFLFTLPLIVAYLAMCSNARAAGVVSGKVTVEDQTLKTESISTDEVMNAGNAIQFRPSDSAGIGQSGAFLKVVVYASAGAIGRASAERQPISIGQDGCHFTDAILRMGLVPLAPYTGQTVSSPDEEIIPVKCDIGAGIRKYFVVLKTAHFVLAGENGAFTLNGLTPGKYTITAWEENYGSQSMEITISGNETAQANFVFRQRSKT